MNNSSKKSYISNILKCTLFCLICGSIVGAIIFFFKFAASKIEYVSRYLYNITKANAFLIILVFIVLIGLAILMYILHKKIPETKGGGIPRSEGVLRGILPLKSIRTFLGTIVGSFMSYFAGLPLGTEGPSVIIGTSIGDVTSKTSKNNKALDRYIKTGGAAAGFAVATGAPLSGVLFSLEEIHKRFTPMLVISVSVATIAATLVNNVLCHLFGIDPRLFDFSIFSSFELKHIGYLVLLALLIGLMVGLFDKTLERVNKFTAKNKKFFHPLAKLISAFVITGILAYVFSDAVYSGHHVVEEMIVNNKTIWFLLGLLLLRLLMMFLLTDSSATGGIFIPVLAIASVIGAILGKLLLLIGLEEEYFPVIVILTMCAFIGGTLRAPFTSAVLFLELTFSFTDLFYVILVIFIVNVITEMFNQPSFYDRALEKMEEEHNEGKEAKISHFKVTISDDAFVIGKAVRDIMWPYSSVVVSIKRYKEDLVDTDNDGEKKLYAKDTIVLRCRYFDEDEIRGIIKDLVGNTYEIERIEI